MRECLSIFTQFFVLICQFLIRWGAQINFACRYDQVIHMVSAARGAETFYTLENHSCRFEDIEEARVVDQRAGEAWVGHPYLDVVDNSSANFDAKIQSLIYKVARKTGVSVVDKLNEANKIKFVVNGPLPQDAAFPKFRDFDVVHDYLKTSSGLVQSRLRKRGRKARVIFEHSVTDLPTCFGLGQAFLYSLLANLFR